MAKSYYNAGLLSGRMNRVWGAGILSGEVQKEIVGRYVRRFGKKENLNIYKRNYTVKAPAHKSIEFIKDTNKTLVGQNDIWIKQVVGFMVVLHNLDVSDELRELVIEGCNEEMEYIEDWVNSQERKRHLDNLKHAIKSYRYWPIRFDTNIDMFAVERKYKMIRTF